MRLKFLLTGPKKIGSLSHDLLRAIEARGHNGYISNTRDFIFEIENNKLKASAAGISDLFDFDIYLFRSFSMTMANSRIFIEELRKRKKIVIEKNISDYYINSKLAEGVRLIRKGLYYPRTYQISDRKNKIILPKNIFPAIVKPADGARGRDIKLIKNKPELYNFLNKHTEDFLIQEYLEIKWDVRVFVVGNKVLGGIKRHVLEGDCRSNASLGSAVECYKITPETKKIALAATKALGYAVAGVDLAWVENKKSWYVLEVNISPQWHAFKRITGINPADSIIDYAIKKHFELKNKS